MLSMSSASSPPLKSSVDIYVYLSSSGTNSFSVSLVSLVSFVFSSTFLAFLSSLWWWAAFFFSFSLFALWCFLSTSSYKALLYDTIDNIKRRISIVVFMFIYLIYLTIIIIIMLVKIKLSILIIIVLSLLLVV